MSNAPQTPMTILIVDDSANLRTVIRRYLSVGTEQAFASLGRPFQFVEAGNGEQAELVLQEQGILGEPVDLIFLDWMMPKVSGYEFLQKIRSTEAFKTNPKIVMLTAETYPEQMHACVKFGVNAYLTKPFTQENIVNVVLETFGSRELKHAV